MSPAGLLDTGDLAFVGQFTEADTADAVFSQIRVRTAADTAAGIFSCGELRRALLFNLHRSFCHEIFLLIIFETAY